MNKLFISLTLMSVSSMAWGAQLGLTATGISSTIDARDYTIGWSFSVAGPIQVTALGYFDADGDGLLNSHNVGIFNSAGTLLVSTTVGSGFTDTLFDNWRMASIAPFALGPGTYVVAAEQASSSDPITISSGPITAGPGITVLNSRLYNFGTGLILPTLSGNTYLQANFLYNNGTTGPVIPEPGTAAMFVAAAGVAVAQMLRRRR